MLEGLGAFTDRSEMVPEPAERLRAYQKKAGVMKEESHEHPPGRPGQRRSGRPPEAIWAHGWHQPGLKKNYTEEQQGRHLRALAGLLFHFWVERLWPQTFRKVFTSFTLRRLSLTKQAFSFPKPITLCLDVFHLSNLVNICDGSYIR